MLIAPAELVPVGSTIPEVGWAVTIVGSAVLDNELVGEDVAVPPAEGPAADGFAQKLLILLFHCPLNRSGQFEDGKLGAFCSASAGAFKLTETRPAELAWIWTSRGGTGI